ncbi:MAG: GNAT family N-acetyltransferase [Candidatus Cloacimonetes bacterium]|nr:GNAT family N-acetyltransferase [Candidatus Cloacimonadota bacterium]
MQGIARRLVDKVEGWLHKLGINIIACLVEDWNMNSKKFFESLGYNMFADIVYFTKKRYPDV